MCVYRQSLAGISRGDNRESNLLVRKVLFRHVYYNNGNSLPVFSIPSCWGNFGRTRRVVVRCISDFSSKAANGAIESVFGRTSDSASLVLKVSTKVSHLNFRHS